METRIRKNESIDDALKRFRRECQKAGILSEIKKRRFYEKPSEKRKRKMETARRKKHRK